MTDQELVSKWNTVAQKFKDHYGISENVMDVDPRVLKTIRYLKIIPKTSTILDVGCGAGHLLRLLQNIGFTDLTGTEISPDRLQIANSHSIGINYIISDTLSIFPNNSIDVITATGVIEHLEHPETFYNDCARVLRPEGKLIVTSDCYLFRLQKWLGFYKTVQPIDNAPYPTNVIKMAEKSGFELIHYDAWGSWWFHIYLAATNFISNITPKFVRKPFIKIYEKGLKTATNYNGARKEFQIEEVPTTLSKFATLKCICLIGDVFYFEMKK